LIVFGATATDDARNTGKKRVKSRSKNINTDVHLRLSSLSSRFTVVKRLPSILKQKLPVTCRVGNS